MTPRDAALAYLRAGLSVVPVRARDKRPLVAWQDYQHRRATEAEVGAWFEDTPNAGIGIVTGAISRLLVLDVDGPEGRETLKRFAPVPVTWRARTARGEHLYFRHPGGAISNFVKRVPGLDLRGDGGYVVAPPSVHPSGVLYEWSIAPEEADLADCPGWLLDLLAPGDHAEGAPVAVPSRIREGTRNTTLYRLARSLRRKGLTPAAILAALEAENMTRCTPPLAPKEVCAIAGHAASQADRPEFRKEGGTGEELAERQRREDHLLREVTQEFEGLEANPPPEALGTRLKKVRELLNGADPVDRAVVRDPLIRRLETLKVRSPAALADAALADAALAADQAEHLQGGRLDFVEPEPWPQSVDGAPLLAEITRVLEQFIALPRGAAVAIALWIVHAHSHSASEVSPILAVTSPTKRCGKTTLLTILSAIVPRALSTSNISPSAIFRTIEKFGPTLVIDEADTFVKLSDETRGILNAAHTRFGAWVVRNVGDEHEPRRFSTWCPKAVALIGKLPDSLRDRSIEIPMRRRSKGEEVKRFRTKLLKEFEPLRRRAARWAKGHLNELEHADPAVPEELDDRAQDNWRQLLAIADLIGGVWPARAREATLLLSGAVHREEDAAGIQLLADVRQVFVSCQADRLPSSRLVDDLVALEERPWREWGRRGKPLTQRQRATLLKPFGIFPKTILPPVNQVAANPGQIEALPPEGGVTNSRHRESVTRTVGRCEVCGRDRPSDNWGRVYCSNACRQRAYRRRKAGPPVAPVAEPESAPPPSGADVVRQLKRYCKAAGVRLEVAVAHALLEYAARGGENRDAVLERAIRDYLAHRQGEAA